MKFFIVSGLNCNRLTQHDWQKSSLAWLKVLILWWVSPKDLKMHNRMSHFQIKWTKLTKISSSALITWSIISIRTVNALAMGLVRSLLAACCLSPVSHRKGICWVKLIWWTGAVRAGWKPKQQWLSFSEAPPSKLCPSPFKVLQDRQDFCHLQLWQTAKCCWNQNSFSQHPFVAAWTC